MSEVDLKTGPVVTAITGAISSAITSPISGVITAVQGVKDPIYLAIGGMSS